MDRQSRLRRSLIAALVALLVCSAAFSAPKPLADHIVVLKAQRKLQLYRQGKLLKSYSIALGQVTVGPKTRQGDHRTPEGIYRIDSRNPRSRYHLALHISYPNEQDRARARKLGVSPGGDIMIHGLPDRYAYLGALHRQYDWTDGCIAVTNAEIEEIWNLVPLGTTIELKP